MNLVASFRQGHSPIEMNAIDYYCDGDKIIAHSWAMGGETKEEVSSVPDVVAGYTKIKEIPHEGRTD